MTMLSYQTGDATRPTGPGPKVIVHVCNDAGHWGAGFVLALSRRWKAPEEAFRTWASGAGDRAFELGQVQFVPVEPDLWVANLIGQHDIQRKTRPTDVPPVRYDAIREGLARTRAFAIERGASVHMPRIGAGLAGGDWGVIERIVQDELSGQDVPVTVYDLPRAEGDEGRVETNHAGTR
ncbi:O-acetyl-ADP-ribose deacetylase (regulator of RNase III) [Deinococcus enclensis]|uniref:O-acetyl-ADP-ribose deacetylase (Regulator of RNase III) n=2 Tax=Deinococcus enclensis TaxID=1049582 RepID=A0ABT9MFJ7_9DEIO|nr:O-acetyl-ADP-ribose deacetylase (regulator of RNase III) [Deinococcus enclensis]